MRAEGGGVNRNFEARRLALIAAMLLFSVAVSAQKLVIDPTRPPVGFGSGAADTESDTAGGIRLQSVMISPTRSAAIINGVMVRLGEKYGDAVLVRVAESEVVLRSGDAQQVLKIHPGVEKREITPVALAAPAAVKSAPRKAKAKAGRDAKPPADAGAPVRQGARP
jgi:MSHA biogenesis protein MshK